MRDQKGCKTTLSRAKPCLAVRRGGGWVQSSSGYSTARPLADEPRQAAHALSNCNHPPSAIHHPPSTIYDPQSTQQTPSAFNCSYYYAMCHCQPSLRPHLQHTEKQLSIPDTQTFYLCTIPPTPCFAAPTWMPSKPQRQETSAFDESSANVQPS